MDREKQIEEMEQKLVDAFNNKMGKVSMKDLAEVLHNSGYRKSGWISVKDRLPEENQLVLCYRYYNDVDLCRLEQPFTYLNNNRYYWYSFKERDCDHVQDKDYWMPLPAPPTEKENGYDT